MKTKHAIITKSRLAWLDGEQWALEPCPLLTDIMVAEHALSHRITHVWLMPDCIELLQGESGGDWSIKRNERHSHTATTSLWKRGAGHVDIIDLKYTSWIEGAQAFKGATPKELLLTIDEMESKMGVPVTGSSGGTGWAFLKKLHPEWIEALPVNLRDLHFTPKAGGDLIWQSPFLAEAPFVNPLYIHKFDAGGAYPYAGTQTDVGVGTPEHLEGEAAARASVHEKGHPQEVGVWRCTIKYDPNVYDAAMPPIWKEDRGSYEASEGWLSGPIIRMLRTCGHTVTVHEGNVFPQRHDVLVKWGNLLWEFRQQATNERARKGFKQLANAAIGFTAFKGFEDEDEKQRPDIRLQVVSRNREIMTHRIRKVGQPPAMVYMDAVYYLHNNPDGRAAFSELVKREGKFGGMRYEGRIEVTPDVQEMFGERMSVAERLEYLNNIGWAH